MNWKDLEFKDCKVTAAHKGSKTYCQQYLKPSYYLELYFRETEANYLEALYNKVLHTIGDLFEYHNYGKKMRDKTKTFTKFPEFLHGKSIYHANSISNVGGIGKIGKPDEFGGVGDASFNCWIHKGDKNWVQRHITQYKNNCEHFKTEMLPSGVIVSSVKLCFPIDCFKTSNDFLNWILELDIVTKGHFFSGSAGYKINFWEGYHHEKAKQKLYTILQNYPGFDYDISIGDSLGRKFNANKTDVIPMVKRMNWLTFINEDSYSVLGGLAKLKTAITQNEISNWHSLNHGAIIQATETPVLSKDDKQIDQYYYIHKTLAPIMYSPHPKDRFTKELTNWFYKFSE